MLESKKEMRMEKVFHAPLAGQYHEGHLYHVYHLYTKIFSLCICQFYDNSS